MDGSLLVLADNNPEIINLIKLPQTKIKLSGYLVKITCIKKRGPKPSPVSLLISDASFIQEEAPLRRAPAFFGFL